MPDEELAIPLRAHRRVPRPPGEAAEFALRIGERFRRCRQVPPQNLEPLRHAVMIGQQPRLHRTHGKPQAEARRRLRRELRSEGAGAGRLLVEIAQHEDPTAMFRSDNEPRNPPVEGILAPRPPG